MTDTYLFKEYIRIILFFSLVNLDKTIILIIIIFFLKISNINQVYIIIYITGPVHYHLTDYKLRIECNTQDDDKYILNSIHITPHSTLERISKPDSLFKNVNIVHQTSQKAKIYKLNLVFMLAFVQVLVTLIF